MIVSRLQVHQLRNLKKVDVFLGPGFSIVSGLNGAGKTTLLEALYLLSRGRTFRGRKAGDLTTYGESETILEALVEMGAEGDRRWVYRRHRGIVERTVDSIPVRETVGRKFLVRLVGENPQMLFDSEPALRRRFMDWNTFHVEPKHGAAWFGFQRVLRQRNAWLRSGAKSAPVWDQEFCLAGQRLTEIRSRFFHAWSDSFDVIRERFHFSRDLSLDLMPGWPQDRSLSDSLEADYHLERKMGFTRVGPGRADFRVLRDGRPVSFSRGQSKVLVCLLQLAARNVLADKSLERSMWLLDDVASDLDQGSIENLLDLFRQTTDQCVLTVIGDRNSGHVLPIPTSSLFHVEQGSVNIPT